jgi:Trk K+ transport system NAD-binding subunit
MDRPIILCGLGRIGRRVLDYLIAANLPVVIIDTVCKPDDPVLRGAQLIVGDCSRREVLESASLANARGVLILTNDDRLNVSTALMVRSLDKDVRIVLRMFNQNLLSRLGRAVNNVYALSTSLLTAPILAMTALTGQSLGAYRIDDSPQGLRQLVEHVVGPTSPLYQQHVAEIASLRDIAVVAHIAVNGEIQSLLGARPEAVLDAGDRVILHGSPRALVPLITAGGSANLELRWANWLYRAWRVGLRTALEMDRAVLICAVVLILVVVVSTVVFAVNVQDHSVPRALLRTVSIMATEAPLPNEELTDSPIVQVFVSALRLVGVVLLAVFTAIVTKYFLQAKFRGMLEIRRVPEAGHFVVCGLSAVGFRVVEELLRLKERVVVINDNPGGRFVTTARQLGAVVLIGDATVFELLRQANAGAARAVVPTTNNDMTNLEVSLLVRELNPDQRVVPLLNDRQFAQMLRDAIGVRLAVSEPTLAAPAFLAALYGDRVESVFFVGERLFALIHLLIDAEDAFLGEAIEPFAETYRLIPIALMRKGEGNTTRHLTGGQLQLGDHLVGIVGLEDLELLFRRQPPNPASTIPPDAGSESLMK